MATHMSDCPKPNKYNAYHADLLAEDDDTHVLSAREFEEQVDIAYAQMTIEADESDEVRLLDPDFDHFWH